MNFQQQLNEIKQYAVNYFDTHTDSALVFHNIGHTRSVVEQVSRIAKHYKLSDEDRFVVIAAAWFHDMGYFANKHEPGENSVAIAVAYLEQRETPVAIIEKVKECILAAHMLQQAEGLLQQIVCDANLFYLGTRQFWENCKLKRKEEQAIQQITIDKGAWREKIIEMLRSHTYYTDFVKTELSDQYGQNLQKMLSKQAQADAASLLQKAGQDTEPALSRSQEKVQRLEKPERGIETMFRITSGNNQRLSSIAHIKAQILITVNSIILSAIISLGLRGLDEASFLTIPTFILLTVNLLTMVFAILATRPAINEGVFTQSDIDNKLANLLFFGNFYKMQLEDYSAGMQKLMNDKDFLYGTLTRDVYAQGVMLGRKYRLLRLAYNVFMFGLIISVLAFVLASVINNHSE